jgi:uncharacterized OsmC-like protein
MQGYPHLYAVRAAGAADGLVTLEAERLATLKSAPPAEFDGPGDQWSPETLLCASVADCLILTFRAIARHSRFDWIDLRCTVEGKLDKVEGVTRFTDFTSRVTLTVPAGADAERARVLLEKSERGCLIANSLTGQRHLEIEIVTA